MEDIRQAWRPQHFAVQTAIGSAIAAAITVVCFPFHLDLAIAGCLYLLLVVVQSTYASFASSAVVSCFSIICLDYFFVPPFFTLRISRPLDGLALVTFLATSLVITRLASRGREEARKAEARRGDIARLYELASRLVSVDPDVAVKRGYLNIFREIFDLKAICLFDGDSGTATCDGHSRHKLFELTREAYAADCEYDSQKDKVAVRSIRTGGKAIGAVGFEGLEEGNALVGPLSMLAAAMVLRARSFEQASAAAAATQVEVLRSAILDAFAHQLKTPLAAILAAAGSVRATGPLVGQQEEMVETIEVQAMGLGHLTTRLLRMARLDRDEIKPKLQILDLGRIVERILNQQKARANGYELAVNLPHEPIEILADFEMLSLAIIQLLDNAFHYSLPGTTIGVTVAFDDDSSAVVRVSNEGPPILAEERNRIFERFFRGAASHQSSGTGLGLYVARKIVFAHGGTLELDAEHQYGPETTFCLRLPLARDEARDELKVS
jgi:two-component system, OmpR family, sensor histidine kinase KdpD